MQGKKNGSDSKKALTLKHVMLASEVKIEVVLPNVESHTVMSLGRHKGDDSLVWSAEYPS